MASATSAAASSIAATALLAVASLVLLLLPPPQTAHAFLASPPHVQRRHHHSHGPRPNRPTSSTGVPLPPHVSRLAAQSSSNSAFLDDLSARFQGDFDNYDQVLDDRTRHEPPLTPREGGGHEHIHCTLVPINNDVSSSSSSSSSSALSALSLIRPYVRDDARAVRLAAFYFDGLPERIFRFRLYALWDASVDSTSSSSEDSSDANNTADAKAGDEQGGGERVGMTLYSLSPEVEGRLRGLSGRPLEWAPALLRCLASAQQEAAEADSSDFQPFLELHGCDVEWRPDPDPDRHAYAYGSPQSSSSSSPSSHRQLQPDDAHHAVMVDGEATIPSLMNPGSMIRVVDELSLWEDDFWINDRGFDPDTGDFVYGNQRGVPYKMRRVSSLVPPLDGGGAEDEDSVLLLQRRIDNEALAWTLGDDHRSSEEYNAAMEAIGGASARMNAPPAAPPPPPSSKGG
mmetsp:Transcript_10833/g.30439  ORF Transcript_10833/g.30439 Transcript_10833/m.30439 type:complete len:457 (-) Transcript_10833:368-1738(-)